MIVLRDHHTCETALAIGARSGVLFRHHCGARHAKGAGDVALWAAAERGRGGAVRVAVFADSSNDPAEWVGAAPDLRTVARRAGVPVLDLGEPLVLAPVLIPKPWGREIWFTGIEARGQSEVVGDGGTAPLQWLLSVAAEHVLGAASVPLNLLKILDPLPDPVYGDLYFELHRQKNEVYVVSGIDPSSWPRGQGAIRFGFAPGVRGEYASDGEFRAAYLTQVQAYRQIREAIDAIQDGWRRAEGRGLDEPVPALTLRRWHAALPPALRLREAEARAAMERYTHLLPLQVGDIVQIPPLLPHALQHGVRTVEFQTPVYERQILSFAQKVLTQNHWDTEACLAEMMLAPPPVSELVELAVTPDHRHERIATFPDFVVERLTLAPAAEWVLETNGAYALLMVVTGVLAVGDKTLGPEMAVLIPAACIRPGFRNLGQESALVLVSRPRQRPA